METGDAGKKAVPGSRGEEDEERGWSRDVGSPWDVGPQKSRKAAIRRDSEEGRMRDEGRQFEETPEDSP